MKNALKIIKMRIPLPNGDKTDFRDHQLSSSDS